MLNAQKAERPMSSSSVMYMMPFRCGFGIWQRTAATVVQRQAQSQAWTLPPLMLAWQMGRCASPADIEKGTTCGPAAEAFTTQHCPKRDVTFRETCASQKSGCIACETTYESALPVWSQAANDSEEHQAKDLDAQPQLENAEDSSDSDAGPKRKRKQRKSKDKGAHRISTGRSGSAAGNTFFADL